MGHGFAIPARRVANRQGTLRLPDGIAFARRRSGWSCHGPGREDASHRCCARPPRRGPDHRVVRDRDTARWLRLRGRRPASARERPRTPRAVPDRGLPVHVDPGNVIGEDAEEIGLPAERRHRRPSTHRALSRCFPRASRSVGTPDRRKVVARFWHRPTGTRQKTRWNETNMGGSKGPVSTYPQGFRGERALHWPSR